MVNEIITVYCICDDYLQTIGHKDHHQARMSTSEVLTTAIIAARFFGGNYEKSRIFLLEHNYIPNMLSKSRFSRRLDSIDQSVFKGIFLILAKGFKATNRSNDYVIDSFPVAVCSNVRINRCKIYKDKKYHGFSAAKQNYFFGIRVHILITKNGEPVEFIIEPGSFSDIKVAQFFKFDLPKKSTIHADKGYNDYGFEDYLEFYKQINFAALRKSNAKRKNRGTCRKTRKIIETTFSRITAYFGRKIHAITSKGFELKITLFIFAYTLNFLVAT